MSRAYMRRTPPTLTHLAIELLGLASQDAQSRERLHARLDTRRLRRGLPLMPCRRTLTRELELLAAAGCLTRSVVMTPTGAQRCYALTPFGETTLDAVNE